MDNMDGYIEGYVEGIKNIAVVEKRPLDEREMAEIAIVEKIAAETKRNIFRD